MNPAWSVIFFTTLAGAAQGMIVTFAMATLFSVSLPAGLRSHALLIAMAMLVAGLGASFGHLGRPERAWRAVMMWRTSWLSREVIVLPAFIAVVGLWWLAVRVDPASTFGTRLLPIAVLLIAGALWVCTAMIYACLRFVQEWAHPLTIINYTLIGLSSGLVLSCTLAVLEGAPEFAYALAPIALAVTLLAGLTRMLALRRNARLKHISTLQSATGIQSVKLVQRSMGMSAGAFNTREFFHGVKASAFRQIKHLFLLLGFAVPIALLVSSIAGGSDDSGGSGIALVLAFPLQYAGLLAERWFFFAQARHPQNLYYQVVS